jgi:hypothetical protein
MKKSLRRTAAIIFICLMLPLYGCATDSITYQTTAQATTAQEAKARETTAPAFTLTPTTGSTATASSANKTFSYDWSNKNDQGYSWIVTLTEWTPIIGGNEDVIQHPYNSEFSVTTSDEDYDSAKDAIIPVMISLKNTTEGFDLENAASVLYFHVAQCNDSTVTNDLNTPKTIDVFSYSPSRGTSVYKYYLQSYTDLGKNTGVEVSASLSDDGSPGLWWNPISSGKTVNALFFVIIHNFITPANPKGNLNLLDYVAIFPSPISTEAITLSGKDITTIQ